MSPQLISRNLDLLRLQEDGFDVAIVANHLVVRNVPFVTRRCTIAHGMLVSTLSLSGDRTQRSEEHTSELQSLMRNSYAVFCLKTPRNHTQTTHPSVIQQPYTPYLTTQTTHK